MALNIGGIHSNKYISVLGKFRNAIVAAGANSERDAKDATFFQEHGFIEGCTMCFMLMISPRSDDGLKDRIFRTVIRHSNNLRLLANDENHASSFQSSGRMTRGFL